MGSVPSITITLASILHRLPFLLEQLGEFSTAGLEYPELGAFTNLK